MECEADEWAFHTPLTHGSPLATNPMSLTAKFCLLNHFHESQENLGHSSQQKTTVRMQVGDARQPNALAWKTCCMRGQIKQ